MNRRFGTERLVEKQDLFILQIQQVLENPFTISHISLMLQKANQSKKSLNFNNHFIVSVQIIKVFFICVKRTLPSRWLN